MPITSSYTNQEVKRWLPTKAAQAGDQALLGSVISLNAGHFMTNGDQVAIQLEFAGQLDDARLAQPGVDLIRIEKIAEMRFFSPNQDEEGSFWEK